MLFKNHGRTVVMAALSLAAVLGLARMADSRNAWFRAWEGECAAREARETELAGRVKALEDELAAERGRAAGLESALARAGEEEFVACAGPEGSRELRQGDVVTAGESPAFPGDSRADAKVGELAATWRNHAPRATIRLLGAARSRQVVVSEVLTKVVEAESQLATATYWIDAESIQLGQVEAGHLTSFVSGGVTLQPVEPAANLNQGVDYVDPAENGIPEPARAGGLNQGVDYAEPAGERSGLNQGVDYVDPAAPAQESATRN